MSQYAMYIMANQSGSTLYTGSTAGLVKRVEQHRAGKGSAFTARYKTTRLVYYVLCDDLETARDRERVVKGWVRRKKIALITDVNPGWRDLSDTLGD
jgi:putative endonuclease